MQFNFNIIVSLYYYMISKLIAGVLLFLQVGFFAQVPYLYTTFTHNPTINTVVSCFSSGLFLALAMLHILPDANYALNRWKHSRYHHSIVADTHLQGDATHHIDELEWANLICILTFVLLLTIQTYFHDGKNSHDHTHPTEEENIYHSNVNMGTISDDDQEYYQKDRKPTQTTRNMQVILTQFALSIHSFFECMAIGIQKDNASVMTLATGIIIHKWAQGLTLGFTYKKGHFSRELALKFTLGHATLNGGAVLMGWMLSSENQLVMGVLSAISAGTFLYICMIQKIKHQFSSAQSLSTKVLSLISGLLFVVAIS